MRGKHSVYITAPGETLHLATEEGKDGIRLSVGGGEAPFYPSATGSRVPTHLLRQAIDELEAAA